MHRFFAPTLNILADKIIIDDKKEMHHLKNVLRLKEGERVEVFDENGNEYACVITGLKDKIQLEIKDKISSAKIDDKIELSVACAIPKKAKIDEIIDKLVQLGVARIIPLETERVIVKLDKHKEGLRLERWKKIALAASKQSKRSGLAVIEPVRTFTEIIARSCAFDLKLIPHLAGKRKGIRDVLDKFIRNKKLSIIVLIGPEGDFSAQEVRLAIAAGFIPVSLGDAVLRVDTAAIALASFIKLYAHR